MSQHRELMYELCTMLKRCLWFGVRYPAFSSAFIERHIERPTTSGRELLEYRRNCTTSSKRNAILLMLLYIAYSCKCFYAAYESLELYDYEQFVRNIGNLNSTHKSIGSCLVTNCTRLAPHSTSLGEDASKLPIFSLCHPTLDLLYTPFTKLDTFGIFTLALMSYTVCLLASWITIQQLVIPTASELIMFIVAPRITHQVVCERAKLFLHNLATSYENFCTTGNFNSLVSLGHRKVHTCACWPPDESKQALLKHKTPEQLDKMIKNCLSIVRSEWWRQKVATLLISAFIWLIQIDLAIFLFAFYVFIKRSVKKGQLMASYAREMERQQCYIWLRESDEISLDLESINVGWSWYSSLENPLLNYGPNFIICIMLAYFWNLLCETIVRLAELRMFLVATLLTARLHNLNNNKYQHVYSSGNNQLLLTGTRNFYTIPNLRRLFKRSFVTLPIIAYICMRHRDEERSDRGYTYLLANSKSNDRYQVQTFLREISRRMRARKMMTNNDDGEFNIETLEQIYINFRLFVDYIHTLKLSVTIGLGISNFLNYGYVLVAIICHRKMAKISSEDTIFVTMFAWLMANFYIFLSATVHGNAKKLHPLIWSVIAELTQWKDSRAKHLRLLWLKQMAMLDDEGGLALSALGIRITYVSNTQLMIWTATIFVIALKH